MVLVPLLIISLLSLYNWDTLLKQYKMPDSVLPCPTSLQLGLNSPPFNLYIHLPAHEATVKLHFHFPCICPSCKYRLCRIIFLFYFVFALHDITPQVCVVPAPMQSPLLWSNCFWFISRCLFCTATLQSEISPSCQLQLKLFFTTGLEILIFYKQVYTKPFALRFLGHSSYSHLDNCKVNS